MAWYLITHKDNLQNIAVLIRRCLCYRLLSYVPFSVQKGCYTVWANLQNTQRRGRWLEQQCCWLVLVMCQAPLSAITPTSPWVSKRFRTKGHIPYCWLIRGPHVKKILMVDIPNRLNYCLVFITYIQFTKLATSRIIQPGGPRVGDPWTSVWAVVSFLISSKHALEKHLQLGHDHFLQCIFHITIPTVAANPKT
jgi:hypothetical protein